MVFSKLGPLRTKYIDKAGKYLLACRSMQLCQKELRFFARNINQPGFSSLVVSLVSEFKRYGVTADTLRSAAETTQESALTLKLLDLATIYDKFDRLVDENWCNAEDNLSVALPKIASANFLTGQLYINHFRSFTPVEYLAIKALMPKMDICVALCTDSNLNNSAVFSTQILSYQKLCSIAANEGIEIAKPLFFNESQFQDKFSELLHLKENYFAAHPKVFEAEPKSLHIAKAPNYYLEVQQTAQLIKKLCRTRGYSLNDFLILTGSMENYELILPSIFAEYELSFFLDQKIRLTESPFMKMIISVLEILAFGFSYERIMSILRSGFWNIDKNSADIFENYILAADITHKQWNSREDWRYNPNRFCFDMDIINQIKADVVYPLLNLIDLFSGRKTVSTICNNLCDWLNSISIPDNVDKKIRDFTNDGNIEKAEQFTRVWSSFVSIINQISDCMGDQKATFAEFYELFSACCSELTVGIIPPTQDMVVVSEIERFRSANAKVVIVLGVVDGSFPKSRNTEGILSDADRQSLKEIGLELAPDCYNRQKEEQFLIYSVFAAAEDELYLFSPISDREGKSLGSSEIIKRVSAIFPCIEVSDANSATDNIEGKNHSFYELCARLFECGFDNSKLPQIWTTVYDYFANVPQFAAKIEYFKKMYALNTEPPAISKELAKKLYGSPLSLSVSKLEKYNSCAFSFFMKYGLLAEERLLGGLKATDTGTILHDVLCSYFKDKSKKNADFSSITRDDCMAEISSLVDDFAKNSDNMLFATSNYYGYMLMRLKSIASSTAWKLIKFYSQSKFKPTGFEVSFGENGVLPPYQLETKNGKVSLKGFIDRVDSAEINGQNYTAVTDYKSSEKRIDTELVNAGITLQPLIYSNVISKGSSSHTAAMMYLQMNDPIPKFESVPTEAEWESAMNDGIKAHGLFLDEPDVLAAIDPNIDDKNSIHYINCDKKSLLVKELFDESLSKAEECAIKTSENIADGIINANPPEIAGFDPCQYCPYISVCRED